MLEGIPKHRTSSLRAVLFDLDGTLYHQVPVRFRMGLELGLQPLLKGGSRELWRRIRRFRSVRERLRGLGRPSESLDLLQYSEPARELGCEPDELRATIDEWMFRRPLPHLRAAARRHLRPVLGSLQMRGLKLGVFSDYPVEDKLEALGVRNFFSQTLCATDPDVNAFKPHPAGFETACTRWNLSPEQVVYVGDRPEVDAVGAASAGLAWALLGRPERSTPWIFRTLPEFENAITR